MKNLFIIMLLGMGLNLNAQLYFRGNIINPEKKACIITIESDDLMVEYVLSEYTDGIDVLVSDNTRIDITTVNRTKSIWIDPKHMDEYFVLKCDIKLDKPDVIIWFTRDHQFKWTYNTDKL